MPGWPPNFEEEKNWIQSAHNLFWNVNIWLVLVDLIFYGLWTTLLVRSQNGQKLVTKVWGVWSLVFITHVQYCCVGNTAQQCKSGLFQDSDLAGDLENSKSTSGGILCIFGSQTFVPISWMYKKQTSVSHSSTEAEVISLDAGLRMDGIPALDLWDLVIEVFHSSPNQTNETKYFRELQGNLSPSTPPTMRSQIPTKRINLDLTNIDHVPSSGSHSGSIAMLCVFEDNEAVIEKNPNSCFGLVAWQN